MAGRAYWKGYLKLSLVSCPVKLYAATSSSSAVSFNLLHKDTHNRVSMRYRDPELGEVDRSDLVKGYQFEKDRYVVVTQEELDAVEIESSKTIEIDGFVDASAVDPIYLDAPYYMAPDGPVAEETYAVILEAMRKANKVALARVVLSGRERLVTIKPLPEGFLLTTLRPAKDIKAASSAIDKFEVKPSRDMIEMADQIIKQRSIPFKPEAFVDHYEEALLTLIRSKISGGQPVISKAPERGQVINLMDALKRSIEEERRPPAPSQPKERKRVAAAAAAETKKPAPAKKKAKSGA
jgi:DNA end-binding protein Ku